MAAGRVSVCDIESALPYSEMSLEEDGSDRSFVVEDVMIDMKRVNGDETSLVAITLHTVIHANYQGTDEKICLKHCASGRDVSGNLVLCRMLTRLAVFLFCIFFHSLARPPAW